ncbi:hypothetical protein CNY67_06295 [Desulfovibrio sp. G11]|nr:hypothetical protein CNY67_06295 [Desulfovibrio sp. G11]
MDEKSFREEAFKDEAGVAGPFFRRDASVGVAGCPAVCPDMRRAASKSRAGCNHTGTATSARAAFLMFA